ncbi:MAG: ribosomal protein S18-alanine N-acetyltransferase [Halobacteriota archaeon]
MTVPDATSARLRPVERADLYAVVRIEARTFEEPWRLSTFEHYLDAPGFLVLEDPESDAMGESIAGYVVASLMRVGGTRVGHVKDLAVKPARQGAGFGRRLLQGALRTLDSQGATAVRLEVRPSNEVARSLYRSAGFAVAGRKAQYYPDGEDALLLTRGLG